MFRHGDREPRPGVGDSGSGSQRPSQRTAPVVAHQVKSLEAHGIGDGEDIADQLRDQIGPDALRSRAGYVPLVEGHDATAGCDGRLMSDPHDDVSGSCGAGSGRGRFEGPPHAPEGHAIGLVRTSPSCETDRAATRPSERCARVQSSERRVRPADRDGNAEQNAESEADVQEATTRSYRSLPRRRGTRREGGRRSLR